MSVGFTKVAQRCLLMTQISLRPTQTKKVSYLFKSAQKPLSIRLNDCDFKMVSDSN